MTADEIRAEMRENIQRFNRGASPGSDGLLLLLYGMAGEIAAQLAELNEGLRDGSFVLFGSRDERRQG